MPVPPPNAYTSGTKLTVGSHNISIIKYISEGGFAHVYTCNIDPPFKGSTVACLKRVEVPNKWQLRLLRQEVDSMRRLRENQHIVSYIDSHASRLGSTSTSTTTTKPSSTDQRYEVFLLMEYCENNGLIDYMNTRLVNKLQEQEILDIAYQVIIGVAMCHHLTPPLLHRDIKIENVLIDSKGTYKLCDFGSAVPYIPAPRTPQDVQQVRDDIMQHTTPQYRAPEMIDLTKGFPIDDKSDIWALGCFIYKLCYYTTPFESPKQTNLQDLENSILNCNQTLRFNDQPGSMFSRRLKNIIACCLRPDPRRRPNAVQLLGEIASMKGDVLPSVIPYSVKEQLLHMKATESVESSNKLYETFDRPKMSKSAENLHIADPFASIDKSSLLTTDNNNNNNNNNNGQIRTNIKNIPRPRSTFITDSTSRTNGNGFINNQNNNKSTSALKDYVQRQLVDNDEKLSNRKSLDEDNGTLKFLKSKEEEANRYNHRNDTGGSFKDILRKISTGNSINGYQSANNTGNNGIGKKSKISSIKKILTGNSQRKVSQDDRSIEITQVPVQKLSIQRRMQDLLNNSDGTSSNVQKTAKGYGRFTDDKDSEDIDAINALPTSDKHHHYHHKHKSISPPAVPLSLSSSSNSRSMEKIRKVVPPIEGKSAVTQLPVTKLPVTQLAVTKPVVTKPSVTKPSIISPIKKAQTEKLPPPKPKKPNYLKSENSRRLSNSSDLSLPDLDDLEKQFSKRFPSYV